MNITEYFKDIEEKTNNEYLIGEEARKKGLDPAKVVEIPRAASLAAKCVGLISTIYPQINNPEIVNRILELEKQYGALEGSVSFKIAEEIALEKYCKFENKLQAMDAGIRVGFAYNTLGVVSSPIEGFTEIKEGERQDGKKYLKAYFSGPIRSAGTTASCVVLMLIDYIRQVFSYEKFDPSEEECKRTVMELYDYHERVNNLQYLPTEEEIYFIAKNIAIQVDGDPTEKKEVSNFKDLKRIETNFIRGGMCLIMGEGMAQKAAKGLRMLKKVQKNGFQIKDWEWLEDYVKLHEKRTSGAKDTVATYIKDLVAGRPVFGHPSKSGAFRFRYGRSRTSGFSATAVHPAAMGISDCFLSAGTQLKIEKPTKGCVISSCDTLEPPIVKMKNGSVLKVKDFETAKQIYSDVEEIIYFGDLLISFGDVLNRNYELLKSGYVEEWWYLELKKSAEEKNEFLEFLNPFDIDINHALKLSQDYNISLHPKFIYYWSQISYEDFLFLIDWISNARLDNKLILPYTKNERERFARGKRALEILGVEHEVATENVVLNKENSMALLINLGIENNLENLSENIIKKIKENNLENGQVLEIINKLSKFRIRDKAGTFIGSRMGRPEKAKMRKLIGSPSGLFPIGDEGGRLRSANEAYNVGSAKAEFPIYFCDSCSKETIYSICETCGKDCRKQFYCRNCKTKLETENCQTCGKIQDFMYKKIDMKNYFDSAVKKLDLLPDEIPKLIKAIRGTSSKSHIPENLAKGMLRASFNLCVNKDGTIRYDATEMPITHFKPREIRTNVAKLIELGYNKDIYGNDLENEEQILELKPHDILLPSCPDSKDERADEVFFRIAGFIDSLLVRFYGMKPFYNLKTKEDLAGQLVACMAPHNCAGVVGRIIGTSKTQTLMASPYMHAAMRRDCFDYNSYLPVKENGVWSIKKIGQIVDKLNPEKIVDNFGTKEKSVENFSTIGIFGEIKINNFTKHTKNNMFEIKTSLGKSLKVTENHKFLIGNKLIRASELKLGDKLQLPFNISINSKKIDKINLMEYLKGEDLMIRKIRKVIDNIPKQDIYSLLEKIGISKKQFSNFNLRDSYPLKFVLELDRFYQENISNIGKISAKRDDVEVPILIFLNKELLEVIGLYIAEGYSRTISGKKGLNQVYISSFDDKLRNFIKKVFFQNFGLVPSERKSDRVTFSSKVLYLFFSKVLNAGRTAFEKRIPSLFLDLEINNLAHLLRGYFEGDGSAEKCRKKISCDSVSEGLLQDLEFCLSRFGIFAKRYEYSKIPGPKVRDFYIRKQRKIPKFKITKLIIGSDFVEKFKKIGFLSERKNNILKNYSKINHKGMKIEKDENFVYDPIVSIKSLGERESYCLNVATDEHFVIVNSILSRQCDGDEAAVMLLLDVLLNFSKEFLPAHRGGTQDAPLVLNTRLRAGEVDDQILDFELVSEYPLEMYLKAEEGHHHSSEIKLDTVKSRLASGQDPFEKIGFTHFTSDFNAGVTNSAYKLIPSMSEKVQRQMELDEKIRAVNAIDVARLTIDRHFIRDIRGNLRKFSQQEFRCGKCNTKYRRPPLVGNCLHCGGKIIFTISEGSIVKYLEPAMMLAKKYDIPPYLKQSIELTKSYIESIFGKENEKQDNLKKWF